MVSPVVGPARDADGRPVHGAAGAGHLLGGEWFSIEARQTIRGEATTVDPSMATSFSPPSEASGPTVLYLKKVGR
jgi:hypothetical protein